MLPLAEHAMRRSMSPLVEHAMRRRPSHVILSGGGEAAGVEGSPSALATKAAASTPPATNPRRGVHAIE